MFRSTGVHHGLCYRNDLFSSVKGSVQQDPFSVGFLSFVGIILPYKAHGLFRVSPGVMLMQQRGLSLVASFALCSNVLNKTDQIGDHK